MYNRFSAVDSPCLVDELPSFYHNDNGGMLCNHTLIIAGIRKSIEVLDEVRFLYDIISLFIIRI